MKNLEILGECDPDSIKWAEHFAASAPYVQHYLRPAPVVKAVLSFGGLVPWLKEEDLTPEQLDFCRAAKADSISLQTEDINKTRRGIYDSSVVHDAGGFQAYLDKQIYRLRLTEMRPLVEFMWGWRVKTN